MNLCACVCVNALCISVCLWALLSESVCISMTARPCLFPCALVCVSVCLCVCVHAGNHGKGLSACRVKTKDLPQDPGENEKSAVTGGSWGPGDSVRPRESHDIFARTLQLLWGLECGWGWQVRSVLSRDFRQQDDLPSNQHLACRVLISILQLRTPSLTTNTFMALKSLRRPLGGSPRAGNRGITKGGKRSTGSPSAEEVFSWQSFNTQATPSNLFLKHIFSFTNQSMGTQNIIASSGTLAEKTFSKLYITNFSRNMMSQY